MLGNVKSFTATAQKGKNILWTIAELSKFERLEPSSFRWIKWDF
jgi:hypothetical protein